MILFDFTFSSETIFGNDCF